MDEREYDVLDATEASMWWFRGLHGHVRRMAGRYLPAPSGRALDAGCGTGGILAQLAPAFPALQLHGFDYVPIAARRAAAKTRAAVSVASVNTMPYETQSFDLIVCADVLGHRGVDAKASLAECARTIRPGGLLLLNLPAYRWLMSYHEVSGHTDRRVTRPEVAQMLAASGFEPLFLSYWNMFLFPLLVIKRKIVGGTEGVSDVKPFPPLVNMIFTGLMWIEGQAMAAGIPLPFGSSVLVVARRRA